MHLGERDQQIDDPPQTDGRGADPFLDSQRETRKVWTGDVENRSAGRVQQVPRWGRPGGRPVQGHMNGSPR